jgi:hypothetical protein
MKIRVALFVLAAGVAAGCANDASVGPGGTGGSGIGYVDPNDNLPNIDAFNVDPLTAAVPMSPTCTWQVSDPDNDQLSCTIDINADGTNDFSFSPCPSSGSQALIINQPGTYPILFTVSDGRGGMRDTTLTVTATQGVVQPPNDNPPVVTGFSASPTSGVSPLNVQFSFTVFDPDGDSMTCRLLEGSTVLVQPSACGTNEHRSATFATGTHNVTLEVTDQHGATATQSLTLMAADAPPTADVTIAKVEWGQTIVSTNPRLVADKDALLRVYVVGNHAGVTNVSVNVTGQRGSTSLGTLNLTGPATAPTTQNANDLTQQWRVTIPGAWIESGLSLSLNAGGQMQTLTPSIGKPSVLPITAIPVVQGGHAGSQLDITQSMTQIWPLKGIDVKTRANYTSSLTLGATANWDNLLQQLDNVHQMDGSERDWLGWVHITYQSGIFGIGYIGEGTALSADYDVLTPTHELGHNMGRQHAPCGGAADPDPNYPVSSAHLDVQGYNAQSKQLVAPGTYYDIMGYCDPQWVSQYHYTKVQSWLEANPVSISAAAAASAARIVIAGSISGGVVSLRPVTAFLGPDRLSTEGDYRVTVHGNGQVVSVPFKLKQVADGPSEMSHFSVVVPDLGAIDSFEISHAGKVLAKKVALVQHAAGADPKVRVEKAEGGVSLKWSSAEWPYASIAHRDGNERTTLSLWNEGGQAFVSTQGLANGGAFEVSLSDGITSKRVTVAR